LETAAEALLVSSRTFYRSVISLTPRCFCA